MFVRHGKLPIPIALTLHIFTFVLLTVFELFRNLPPWHVLEEISLDDLSVGKRELSSPFASAVDEFAIIHIAIFVLVHATAMRESLHEIALIRGTPRLC